MAGSVPPPHRTQVPNIIDDLGLDPYERALYVHYKRVCGENQGAYCFEATRTTAGKVKMSTGQVSLARKSLAERGLIIVQAESRPVVVTVVNIWEINTAFYKLEYRPDVTDWTIEQVKLWLHDMSTDVHTVNVSSHNDIDTRSPSEHSLTESEPRSPSEHQPIDMSSDVHTVKQRIDSESKESKPIESKLDSSPNGEVPPPLPKEEAIKIEYTTFLRDFLARFNAKRFRNPTQFKTVSDLVDQHGEAELESLAEWAANKGMGLGQAIPAIKSALKNPKRKAPDKSEDVPYVTPPDPIPPPARTPEQLIWQQVLADSPQIPQWLAAEIKPITRSNGTFKLAVSSDSAKQWIDNRLVKVIKPTLNRIDQSISEIEVIVQ